ncbi:MAG: ribbon-helix-helix domain-containing protein [Candidatus Omnitrophota bacterium]
MVRTQVIITQEQYQTLHNLSKERDVSIAALVREAVEKEFVQGINNQKQIAALKRIADRRGKVPAWSEMKKEITQGIVGKKGNL